MPETGMPTSPGLYGVTSDDGRFAVVEVGLSDEVIGYTDDDAPITAQVLTWERLTGKMGDEVPFDGIVHSGTHGLPDGWSWGARLTAELLRGRA
jgi:hypothetical protein